MGLKGINNGSGTGSTENLSAESQQAPEQPPEGSVNGKSVTTTEPESILKKTDDFSPSEAKKNIKERKVTIDPETEIPDSPSKETALKSFFDSIAKTSGSQKSEDDSQVSTDSEAAIPAPRRTLRRGKDLELSSEQLEELKKDYSYQQFVLANRVTFSEVGQVLESKQPDEFLKKLRLRVEGSMGSKVAGDFLPWKQELRELHQPVLDLHKSKEMTDEQVKDFIDIALGISLNSDYAKVDPDAVTELEQAGFSSQLVSEVVADIESGLPVPKEAGVNIRPYLLAAYNLLEAIAKANDVSGFEGLLKKFGANNTMAALEAGLNKTHPDIEEPVQDALYGHLEKLMNDLNYFLDSDSDSESDEG